MKKLLVLFLAIVMIGTMTTVSMGATVYLDGQWGKWDNKYYELDYNPVYFGIEAPMEHWKLSFEYNTGTWKTSSKYNHDMDVTGYLLKGGYAIVNNDAARVDLNLGLYYQHLKNSGGTWDEYTYDNDWLIGVDATFNLSSKCTLDLAYDSFISGKYKSPSNHTDMDIRSLELYKLKVNFLFTDNFGAAVGYRGFKEEPKKASYLPFTADGYTLGVFFKF